MFSHKAPEIALEPDVNSQITHGLTMGSSQYTNRYHNVDPKITVYFSPPVATFDQTCRMGLSTTATAATSAI